MIMTDRQYEHDLQHGDRHEQQSEMIAGPRLHGSFEESSMVRPEAIRCPRLS